MSDLIDRQAAIDALHMHLMYRMGTDSNKKRLDEWINNLPSAQPEIILCKDCKHRCETEDGEYNPEDIVCAYWMSDGLIETDYCSHAERREE